MLQELVIENFILLSRQQIIFEGGFCVITGETGAGKSLILDALLFVLGERPPLNPLKDASQKASISLTLTPSDTLNDLLMHHDLLHEAVNQPLTLRRTLHPDGKTRTYLNDQPLSLSFVKKIAPHILHLHGQFDKGLSIQDQQEIIDRFADLANQRKTVRTTYTAWHQVRSDLLNLKEKVHHLEEEKAYLSAAIQELEKLNLQENEEEILLKNRTLLREQDSLKENVEEALKAFEGESSILHQVKNVLRSLNKVADERSQSIQSKLDTMLDLAHESYELLLNIRQDLLATQGLSLDDVESRLFQLRACARKHMVSIEGLGPKLMQCREQLDTLTKRNFQINALEKEDQELAKAYYKEAEKLMAERKTHGNKLIEGLHQELPPLKLDKVRLRLIQTLLPESQWTSHGIDRTELEVATNAQAAFGPLYTVPSGGELARILLALKTLTAAKEQCKTMIFDEIDQGIGGAVSSAMGVRLLQLGQHVQVIALTHSPQIAALAQHHWVVEKSHTPTESHATIRLLSTHATRKEEVARMLAGSKITEEARKAADKLFSERPTLPLLSPTNKASSSEEVA